MKFIKSIVAGATLVFAVSASASSISPTDFTTQTINDNYIGAGASGDVYGSTSKYNIDKMTVKRQGTTMTVDIFTSFWNDVSSSIKFGDLFMATGNGNDNPWNPYGSGKHKYDRSSSSNNHNTGTNWNYVYDLEGGRSGSSGTGKLKSGFNRSDLYTSTNLMGSSGHRYDQAVRLRDRSHQTTHSTSNWSIGSQKYYINGTSYKNLRLTFDVAGTALATAHQIAFRWTMTCANDIIEGLVSVAPGDTTTPIPAPQTIALMLLGLAGLSFRKKA